MIYTLAIAKGGTGKTTTAAALVHLAAREGKKVLAIDLDPQANLSMTLGADTNSANILDILNDRKPALECITSLSDNISIIPATWKMTAEKLKQGAGIRLTTALKYLKKKYNCIVIDTPPTASELQYIGLLSADRVIIPVNSDTYGIQSIYQTKSSIDQTREYNKAMKDISLIVTNTNTRSTINRQLIDKIKQISNELDLKYLGEVRSGIAVKESAALSMSLYDYAPKSNPAIDYSNSLKLIL